MTSEIQRFGSYIVFSISLNGNDTETTRQVQITISTDGIKDAVEAAAFVESTKEEILIKFNELLNQPLCPVIHEVREVDITDAVRDYCAGATTSLGDVTGTISSIDKILEEAMEEGAQS